jgi:hypothetical protein
MKYSTNPSRFYGENVAVLNTEYGIYQLVSKNYKCRPTLKVLCLHNT